MSKRVLCLLCAVSLMLSGGCRSRVPSPYEAVITYRLTEEPDTLDPQIAVSPAARLIIANLFEGLVREGADGSFLPGAAESWTVSEEGTVYVFTLREDACWSNGEAVTADDFAYGMERALLPLTHADDAVTLYAVKNAEAVHHGTLPPETLGITAKGRQLIIELAYPDADFLPALTRAAAMPCRRAFFDACGGQYGREADQLLTNGAFTVGAYGWHHGAMLSLRRNPAYHGARRPIPYGVDLMFDEGTEDTVQAILDGTTDGGFLAVGEREQAQQNGLTVTESGLTVFCLFFQTRDPLLSSCDLRKALLKGVEQPLLRRSLSADGALTDSLLSAVSDGRTSCGQKAADSTGEAAEALLHKALSALSLSRLPALTILCADDDATRQLVNTIMQSWNGLTGSYCNKKPVPPSRLRQLLMTGDYQIALAPLPLCRQSPEEILSLFSADRRTPLSGLSDDRYQLILRQLHTADARQRQDTIRRAEAYLLTNGIVRPLCTERRYFACAPSVRGMIVYKDEKGVDFTLTEKTERP